MAKNIVSVLKQSGKALCYYALFLGFQLIVGLAFSVFMGIHIGFQAAMKGGTMPSNEELSQQMMQALNENTGLLVILYSVPTVLFLWLFFLIRRRKLHIETGMVSFRKSLLPGLLLLALGITGFLNTALNLLPESWLESYSESSGFLEEGPFAVMLIATGICAPLLEEIIFRGLIFSRLKRAMPVWIAAILSSLLFGLAHGQILWIAYASCLGLVFCLVTQRTGSILPSMLIHAVFNSLGTCLTYSGFLFTPVTFWGMLMGGALLSVVGMYFFLRNTKPRETL